MSLIQRFSDEVRGIVESAGCRLIDSPVRDGDVWFGRIERGDDYRMIVFNRLEQKHVGDRWREMAQQRAGIAVAGLTTDA